MRVLIACEESQEVCKEFRKRGHEAYSCDLLPCGGGHEEWHLQTDVSELLKMEWDMVLAFPPCTHLASSGASWFKEKQRDGRQMMGIGFFLQFTALDHIPMVAIENPVGIMSSYYRKPDQIIHPWMFGDPYEKSTCLWLKGLPKLKPTVEEKPDCERYEYIEKKTGLRKTQPKWFADAWASGLTSAERQKVRSKTFHGIAVAMAEQWGCLEIPAIEERPKEAKEVWEQITMEVNK